MMAAMDITVRSARPDEYAGTGELAARAYLDGGLLDFGEDDPYLERLRDTPDRAAHAELLVAVDATDTLLGTVTFVGDGGPYAERAGEGEGEFRMLAVCAEARARGVGEALVAACVERAHERGLTGLVLSAQQHTYTAHRLYERAGFRRAPERDWSPLDDIFLWAYTLRL